MESLLTGAVLTALLTGAVTAATPLFWAGLGEQISQKAGVLNIGLEGMMLLGAFAGFMATWTTGSFFWGALAGIVAGLGAAALVAGLCVGLGLNQIVTGIALTLGAEGLTGLLHHRWLARGHPRLDPVASLPVPGLEQLPVLGPALFDRSPLVYGAFIVAGLLGWMFRHTHAGLNLAAAGDRPATLDAAGVSVGLTRSLAVLATGAMAGLGGAFLSVAGAGLFLPFMTGGGGFIAIVLAMLAQGRPALVLLGAFLYGLSLSLTTALQIAGLTIPTDLVHMLPFATIIAMLLIVARVRCPD